MNELNNGNKALTILTCTCTVPSHNRNSRFERYGENGWPPSWQPESDLMKEHMRQREIELQHLPGGNERWENYMQYTQSRMVPRFTEVGKDFCIIVI